MSTCEHEPWEAAGQLVQQRMQTSGGDRVVTICSKCGELIPVAASEVKPKPLPYRIAAATLMIGALASDMTPEAMREICPDVIKPLQLQMIDLLAASVGVRREK